MVPEIVVGEPEEVMEGLVGIDFLVVDSRRGDFARVMRLAKLSSKGALLVRKNANSRFSLGFKWQSALDEGSQRRVVLSMFLPIGNGLDIAHVSAVGDDLGSSVKGAYSGGTRWIKHVDWRSGDVHIIRH